MREGEAKEEVCMSVGGKIVCRKRGGLMLCLKGQGDAEREERLGRGKKEREGSGEHPGRRVEGRRGI